MKIWKCGSSPRSGSRNAWTQIKSVKGANRLSKFWNFFGAIQMISCRARLVTMDEPSYITMTRRQSNNQWSGGIVAQPAQKNSECKNPMQKFSSRFFGIRTVSSSLNIFQRAKLSTRSITHLCWCKWRTFWRKNATQREGPQGVLFLHDSAPAHRALATQKKLAYPGFQCLITHPILRIWPPRTTTCSLDWKNNWKVAIFHPMRRSLLLQRPGWMDNLLNFFWVACKS